LGFDACVSHKSATLAADLRAACPAGIDAYFENVGGPVFEAVLPLFNRQARISLCGLVSQYGSATQGDPHEAWMAQGAPTFERQHVQVHRLHVRNFVQEHQSRFLAPMADWIRAGTVKYKEDLWPGLAQAPKAFRAMLEGGNFGKTLVGVGEDPTLNDALQARRASTNVLSGVR
jgi:NADPH-dependent curcumin reductase CurA